MASVSQLRALTHDLVMKSVTDNVYQSAAGLRRMYVKREKLDGGYVIGHPVVSGAVDDTTGGWYSGASDLADAEKDDVDRAQVDWKQMYETVLISKADINKNGGGSQIVNLITAKVDIAEKRAKSRLSTGIYHNGTDPLKFNGLDEIIHATGAYGGLAISDILDESGNNAWLGRVSANGAVDRQLSGRLIQSTMGLASEDEDIPSVAFSKQNVFDELWAILEPHQRLMVEDESFSGMGHSQKKVLQYNGIPFLIDSHAAAKTIYFVNEKYTKLYVHKNEDLFVQSFKQLENSNAIKERILLMGNLLCSARRFNAKLTDIKVAA